MAVFHIFGSNSQGQSNAQAAIVPQQRVIRNSKEMMEPDQRPG
jgi:hypothetical protein